MNGLANKIIDKKSSYYAVQKKQKTKEFNTNAVKTLVGQVSKVIKQNFRPKKKVIRNNNNIEKQIPISSKVLDISKQLNTIKRNKAEKQMLSTVNFNKTECNQPRNKDRINPTFANKNTSINKIRSIGKIMGKFKSQESQRKIKKLINY